MTVATQQKEKEEEPKDFERNTDHEPLTYAQLCDPRPEARQHSLCTPAASVQLAQAKIAVENDIAPRAEFAQRTLIAPECMRIATLPELAVAEVVFDPPIDNLGQDFLVFDLSLCVTPIPVESLRFLSRELRRLRRHLRQRADQEKEPGDQLPRALHLTSTSTLKTRALASVSKSDSSDWIP